MSDIIIKRTTIIILLAVLLSGVFYGIGRIGINATDSLNFRIYYHTAYNPAEMKRGDYILFALPDNELYPAGLKVVKSISCLAGDTLETRRFADKVDYYCNDKFISSSSVFTTSAGDPLKTFEYSGIIPAGYVFVTGDKDSSYDSRYWGFLPIAAIERVVHPIRFTTSAYAASLYDIPRDRGWYKYEVAQPKEEPIKDNQTTDNATVLVFVKPTIPWERVSTMPAKEFSKLFENVQDYAMSYRTLENFDTYAKLRAVMFSRSMEFMNVGTLWGQLNPEDSSEDWFPTSGFGQSAYQAQAGEIRSKYIRDNNENFGLLYFYRPDCAYCQKQAPLIRYFEDSSGWKVKFINADEIPEAVGRFNIKSVPTLILVERATERWLLVSSGLMTVEEIEERLYRTIKYLKGETDEKDFTNPIRPDNYLVKSSAGGVDR